MRGGISGGCSAAISPIGYEKAMTGNIIQLHGDPHREVLALLPWHVTGQLDAADTARVDAHLETCADCRAGRDRAQRLDREIVRAPVDVDEGWALLRARLDGGGHGRRREARDQAVPGNRRLPPPPAPGRSARSPWLDWLRGAGLWAPLGAAAMLGIVMLPTQVPARFGALGSAASPAAGNMVVIFRPDTSEAVFRQTLRGAQARLVDGPTAANAYVLRVSTTARPAALASLRRQPQIVLAEPIDGERQP
jgi:hypothetical protein